MKEYSFNGKTVQLLSIGELGEYTGRMPQTIRLWEKKGIIPPAPFNLGERGFGKRGRRLYCSLHKEALKTAIDKQGLKQGKPIDHFFTECLNTAYKEIAEGKYPSLLHASDG